MQNIILRGMLEDFSRRQGIESDSEDVRFESFCNYCILSNDHYDSFSFDKVSTGKSQGVDGLAIVIGDVIIDQLEDAAHYTQAQFSAGFHFIQAKTSTSFSLGDFLKFTSVVRSFFNDKKVSLPNELQGSFDIKDAIYAKAGKLVALPTLSLYYAYAGDFQVTDAAVLGAIETEIESLKREKYKFYEVSLSICDSRVLARKYREAQNNTIGSVPYQRHVALPKMSKATAAYIGVMKCRDYVRLIKKENGDINKGLFYENVRDYLGVRNPVNLEIRDTIKSGISKDLFALLNNGVTIVAKKVVPSGDTFELHRFQVVNGCQTSHVLFGNESSLTDDMHVTVKLIETEDADLTNSIIRSTNSQSLVMKEALATTRPYHRVLEDYFSAMKGEGFKFVYERRPHQYDDLPGITQDRIVSAPNLMKSFVSVVLEEPHKVHYYYGRLLEEYNRDDAGEIFAEDHYPGLYFASHVITSLVRDRVQRDASMKPWAYHLSLLIKRRVAPELIRQSNFSDKSFRALIARIDGDFGKAFNAAYAHIKSYKFSENDNRLPDITSSIVGGFKTDKSNVPSIGASSRDGDYVGRLEEVDAVTSIMRVRYGATLVEVPVGNIVVAELQSGALIRFTRSGDQVVGGVRI